MSEHMAPAYARRATLWLGYLLPWWIIIPLGTWLIYNNASSRELDQIRYTQRDLVAHDNRLVESYLTKVYQDVLLLAGSTASVLDSSTAAPDALLASLFGDVGRAYPQYMQIRWLSNQGIEQVRVDRTGPQLKTITGQDLQNKDRRYYVQQGLKTEPGKVYVSPLDLNVEAGQIETPYRPTLRAVTKVVTASGETQGIAVLNLDASQLIAELRTSADAMLVDEQGYWLVGPDASKEWGFMFNDPSRRIQVEYPEVWQRIVTEQAGQFLDEHGLWTFARANPEQDLQISADEIPELYTLSRVTTPLVLQRQLQLFYFCVGAAVLLIVTCLAGFLALSSRRLDSRAKELQHSNAQLTTTLGQLQASQDELVRTEKLSSLGLMVAGVAHELNTPIGAGMLCVTTLADRIRDFKQAFLAGGVKRSELEQLLQHQSEGLQMAEASLNRAATLIQQFRQVAADRANADIQSFSLQALVADILALTHGQWKHSGHQVVTDIPADIEMISYPGPLGQVIQNLLHNALVHAFTLGDTGTISISASVSADQSVDILVSDDGIGIAPEHIKRVFDPFYTTRRGAGGTGLGLHIVHHLTTEVLGGRVWIETGLHQRGTTMHLRFPLDCRMPLKETLAE
ncbi:hypothetical protein C4K68_03770 [Pokkaliibacter plantistimulans]|uniref:histidine kinase n=2 Tax=Pseudomonadota TaxID=1224 RepID=A0A2S5KUU4_9PROT|nr:hypothetical protein C4K68_03770 [Pokkaliibacter plantistimulans]